MRHAGQTNLTTSGEGNSRFVTGTIGPDGGGPDAYQPAGC